MAIGKGKRTPAVVVGNANAAYVVSMRRWLGLFLAIMLSLAAAVPARLHAMAQDHAAPATLPQHANAHDCDDAPANDLPGEHRKHAACITACACLPALIAAPDAFAPAAGERLAPPTQSALPSREPEQPLKPPQSAI
jgi:hypothetical protein